LQKVRIQCKLAVNAASASTISIISVIAQGNVYGFIFRRVESVEKMLGCAIVMN
jgi:hypothetical protein